MDINTGLFFQIYNLSHHNSIMDALMIFGADYLIFIVFLIIIFFAIFGKSRDKQSFILSMLGLGMAFILIQIIRMFVHEPRPFATFKITPLIATAHWVTFSSFPSLHTLIISVITFSYIYFQSKLTPFLIFSLIWIAFARIYVGVHYPLDIVGGILVGTLSICLVLLFKKLLHP